MLQQDRQAVAAGTVLLVLFCGFFWLGFFLGRSSAARAAASPDPAPTPAPSEERLRFNLAGN